MCLHFKMFGKTIIIIVFFFSIDVQYLADHVSPKTVAAVEVVKHSIEASYEDFAFSLDSISLVKMYHFTLSPFVLPLPKTFSVK